MDSVLVGIVVVPAITALLLLLVFTYIYQQTRETYFRTWQLAWAAYCAYYGLLALQFSGTPRVSLFLLGKSFQIATALLVFISSRLIDGEEYRFRWYDVAIFAFGMVYALVDLKAHYGASGLFMGMPRRHVELEVLIAALLAYTAIRFYRAGRQRDFISYRLLAFALVFWSLLLCSRQFHGWLERPLGGVGHLLGPLPQVLIGVGMIMVLFERERRTMQDNVLFFSTLDVDHSGLVSPQELVSSLEKMLHRLLKLVRVPRAAICIVDNWRNSIPSVAVGLTQESSRALEAQRLNEYLADMAYRAGGVVSFRNLPNGSEPVPGGAPGGFQRLQQVAADAGIRNLTALSLQTRDKNFGVLLFAHANRLGFGSSQIRLLLGLAMQIGRTLENHISIQETQRRTREYELLTQMGQVISSHLNSEEVLFAIYKEIGLLIDTNSFYVAFAEGDELRFELEVNDGQVKPKRSRKLVNGLSEWIIRNGQPLLVSSNMEAVRTRLGATFVPGRRSKSFCGVPIFMGGRALGVMAALNFEQEFIYQERDVELLQTAAGQVAVAVENARLFEEQQRRARYLAFLNTVSNAAISSQDAEQMLPEIVAEVQKNFEIDHIGIGVLDYSTKEIEIKAEGGSTSVALGRRIPLGAGIMGRVARTNEMALLRADADNHVLGVLPDARTILCVPLTYGETMLGVLNIESRRDNAFADQEILILRTLADLLATALHNAFVFQKLQQQSITDGLTGIKTRRFFLEATHAEWRRASRSGRPFSVVMVDLDKFKEVNDEMGHLEGDLVLARVGRLLEQKCRQSNVVARYGGDEFVILMPETGIEQAQTLSERLRVWIATDPMLNERRITGSFGVASFPLHGSTVEDVVRVADAGMYVSKHAGGNRVSTAEEFSEAETVAVRRQLIASYIEGFLQREHAGPESTDELIATVRKLCAGLQDDPDQMREAVSLLTRAAEAREVHAAGHGHEVSRYAQAIGRQLRLSESELADLAFAGLVHDVGKLVIPEKTLCKPGPLTREEYYLLKMHASVSGEIVACIPGTNGIESIVRHHHERVDGSGYPDGLRGEEIPLAARILAVADAFASMTRERPFASPRSFEEAAAELQRNAGTQFDQRVVTALLQHLRLYQHASSTTA